MITLDANDEILIRESSTDKEGLVEICTQFNSPRKKCWRFLGTVKNEKIIASQLSSPYTNLIQDLFGAGRISAMKNAQVTLLKIVEALMQ